MLIRSISVTALATALASTAAPAAAPTKDVQLAALATQDAGVIIVTGLRDGYAIEQSSTATRTPTDLNDTPQAISVVTEAQIDDQAMLSIADVLRYVPGAMTGQGEGNRDQITLRGNGSTADFFVDGLRDDVQYYRGLYNAERVEVLKGPNAMIFGRGGGGGVVNRVTKRPLAEDFVRASAGIDSEGAWLVDADVNHAFGADVAVRVNGVYESFDNHRQAYGGERYAINPTLAVSVGERTRIDLSYEYDRDDRVVDRGVPSRDGRPLTGFRDTFFGDPDVNDTGFEANVVKGRVEHHFSDALSLTSRLLYGDYDKFYQNIFPASAVTPAGLFDISSYRDASQRESLLSQTDLILKTQTGGIGHVLLAGFEYANQDSAAERRDGVFAGGGARRTVPLADPFVTPPFVGLTLVRSTQSEAHAYAVYAQDQISFGEHFDVVAGIRYDRFELDVANLVSGAGFSRADDLWSPRLGLVYKPMEPLSFYASYSRSYLPQSGDQFTSLDASTEALKPEQFDNYEVGVKWDILPALSFTAAAYRLDRSNTRAADPLTGDIVLTGGQRSKGLELGLAGQITPDWQVSAGYTLQEAEIRKATTAAPAGREVALVPRHQASFWTRYNFTSRLGGGLGVYHQSKSFTSISNAVVLPAFTRVDAAVFFKLTDAIEAQVNVENLLGEDYFATAHNDNNITPGAPTTARATVRFHF